MAQYEIEDDIPKPAKPYKQPLPRRESPYPFEAMEVGKSFFVPFLTEQENPDYEAENKKILHRVRAAVSNRNKNIPDGKKFSAMYVKEERQVRVEGKRKPEVIEVFGVRVWRDE